MLSSHDLEDLRHRAAPVTTPCPRQKMSARDAACALSGVIRLVATQYGEDAMRLSCATLARQSVGRSRDEATAVIAAAAQGISAVAGCANTQAALAFWACENDPAVWRDVAAAA